MVDLLREVAAEHPDLTESNVYLRVKGEGYSVQPSMTDVLGYW